VMRAENAELRQQLDAQQAERSPELACSQISIGSRSSRGF
jgi:hypothetical protein